MSPYYGVSPIVVMLIAFIAIGIYLAIYIPYALNIKKTLELIRPENRLVQPGNAWLLLIPFFQLIYQFILYPKLSESIEKECRSRGIRKESDYAKNLGLALAILSVAGLLRYIAPSLGQIMGVGSLVVFIIYWVQIYNFKVLFLRVLGDNDLIGGSEDLLDN